MLHDDVRRTPALARLRRGVLVGAALALLLVDGTAAAGPAAAHPAQAVPAHGTPSSAHAAPAYGTPSSALHAVPAARKADRVTLRANATEFRKRESIRLSGKVVRAGKPVGKGVQVRLVRTRPDTGRTKRIATLRTDAQGTFTYRVRPGRSFAFEARAAGARSEPVRLDRAAGPRTLRDRRATVRTQLGKPRGKAVTLDAKQRTRLKKKNISHVRYRDFRKGMLVQVTTNGSVRTWLVRGKIARAYRKAGGPEGRYGVPRGDAQCELLENGCLQRFTGGALYQKKGVQKAAGQVSARSASEVLAVARSQLSYRSGRTNSKFNVWAGSVGQPWCAAFVAWVAAAAGQSKAVPKFARIHQLAPYARKKMTTFGTGAKRKPRLGDLAFFDFRNRGRGPEPSHVGIVVKDRGSSVLTIEGNASRTDSFTPQRGVFLHTRPKNRVLFFADPGW